MNKPNSPSTSAPKSIVKAFAEMATVAASLREIESKINGAHFTTLVDWGRGASQCIDRTVDFVVVYNAVPTERGVDNYQFHLAGHACRVSETEVIAAKEAYDFAVELARLKSGKVMIVCEMQWFEFETDPVDRTSGLLLCRSLKRDEIKWEEFKTIWDEHGLEKPTITKFPPMKGSIMPYTGTELGFVHTGEADNIWPGAMQLLPKQFETGTVSYFQRPADLQFAFKSFVTGVLPSRILYPGSPVFDREGTLLGLIANCINLAGDSGRRAVVKSLLGHPWFKKI